MPTRAIFEGLGAVVTWDAATQTATGVKGDSGVTLALGETTAYVNRQAVELDVPAQVVNERILAPLSFFSESLEAQAAWVDESRSAYINLDE